MGMQVAIQTDGKGVLAQRLPERIFSRIHRDIGQASMSWEHIDKAGVFKAEEASKIAFDLCHFIADELDNLKAKGDGYGK